MTCHWKAYQGQRSKSVTFKVTDRTDWWLPKCFSETCEALQFLHSTLRGNFDRTRETQSCFILWLCTCSTLHLWDTKVSELCPRYWKHTSRRFAKLWKVVASCCPVASRNDISDWSANINCKTPGHRLHIEFYLYRLGKTRWPLLFCHSLQQSFQLSNRCSPGESSVNTPTPQVLSTPCWN
jgi:hypothetical protein